MYHGFYGKTNIINAPYRTDKGGGGADFITVGKIDNSELGIFAECKSLTYTQMLKEWIRLNDNSKRELLREQFHKEKYRIPYKIDNWYATRKAYPNNVRPIFEIANEPNLFPYLSPKLYAEYYMWWHDEIKNYESKAKIMNGGLWVNEVLPKSIVKALPLIGVKVTNTYEYWNEFIRYLPDVEYVPDMTNLHIYPFVNHAWEVEKLMYSVRFFSLNYPVKIWITEYGNINSFNEMDTLTFIRSLYYYLSSVSSIKRAYFFQAQYSERNFQLFYELNKRYKEKRTYRYIIRWLRFLIRRKTSLLYMLTNYIENPPIQYVEKAGKLNSIGEFFLSKHNDKQQ